MQRILHWFSSDSASVLTLRSKPRKVFILRQDDESSPLRLPAAKLLVGHSTAHKHNSTFNFALNFTTPQRKHERKSNDFKKAIKYTVKPHIMWKHFFKLYHTSSFKSTNAQLSSLFCRVFSLTHLIRYIQTAKSYSISQLGPPNY